MDIKSLSADEAGLYRSMHRLLVIACDRNISAKKFKLMTRFLIDRYFDNYRTKTRLSLNRDAQIAALNNIFYSK